VNRRPRLLIFDLDDTLIEEEPARDAALRATAGALAARGVDADRVAAAVRRRARELWWGHPLHDWAYGIGVASWEALWARFEGEAPQLTALRAWAPEFRRESWRRALADLGLADADLAGRLAERFPEIRRRHHRAHDDAEPTLRALRADGRFRLGLLTNGLSCLQREKLRGAGLDAYFDAVVAGGDVGRRKPDRQVFDRVLADLGGAADEALMVGNNPETDIAGALAAGLDAVLIERDGVPPRQAPPELAAVPRVRGLAEVARRVGVAIGGTSPANTDPIGNV